MKIKVLFYCLLLTACANPKLQAIRGKTETDLLSDKGQPVSKLTERGRKMWTYRHEDCTEVVFFDTDGGVIDFYELGMCPSDE